MLVFVLLSLSCLIDSWAFATHCATEDRRFSCFCRATPTHLIRTALDELCSTIG